MAENDKKAEHGRETVIKNTLESQLFKDTIGSNFGKSNPQLIGGWGASGVGYAYQKVTGSEEFNKIRQDGYQAKMAEMAKYGVYGEASMPSNGDISLGVYKQIEAVQQEATLGELEKYCLSAGAKLDFNVPKELSKMKAGSLIQKAMTEKGFNINKLSNAEKDALGMYTVLKESFTRACVLGVADFYLELNAQGKEIAEKYTKKPEEKKPEKKK